MKLIFNKKGFTLIEVITSMAIVGILLLTIISFLGQSFTQIFSLGNRSKGLYSVQEELEESLVKSYGEGEESRKELSFKIGERVIKVEGYTYTKVIEGSNNKEIKAFVPKKLAKE